MRYPTPGPNGGAPWRVRPLSGIHDGDTMRVYVDKGGINETRETWDIRLKGVFAPELSQPGGPECRDFVIQWVAAHGDGTDWPLGLETFQTPRSDKPVTTLSRYVGVITAADGACLNADVVAFIQANGYGGGIGA